MTEPSGNANTRQAFARALWDLADLTRADSSRRSFRATAYRNAIWSLDDLDPGLETTAEEAMQVPGIGPGIVRLIQEFRETGSLRDYERLHARYPAESGRIRRLPRVTPAILRELKDVAGVETWSDLEIAVDSGDALLAKGVGPATLERWAAVSSLWPSGRALPAHESWVLARTARSHFERILRAPVTVTGEVRRVTEWAHTITLVVAGEVSADLVRSSAIGVPESVDEGSVRLDTPFGIPMEVRLATENELGTALVSTTGPEAHLRLLDLSTAAPTEQAVYEASGLNWVAPPARAARLPPDDLIGVDDMRGDLHLHTDSSPDGRITLDELVAALVDMGYSYAAVTDHTAGLRFGGLDGEALMAQKREIERVREVYPEFHLLHGAEINIEPDGTLDIEDEVLDELDIVVAGVHSSFDLSEEEQTRRVTSALAHPRVRVLSHPTGRRIGLRAPLRLDMAAVMDTAATHFVALEANGHRDRLDLNADLAKQAFDRGVVLAANSDAHRLAELANMGNAVASLQAGHLPVDAVVNAREYEEFLTWLRG